VECGYICH